MADFVNSQLAPSAVNNFPWLYERNPAFSAANCQDCGKWMIFVPRLEMDELWLRAKQLYNDGQLPGIWEMKVSTSFSNPRAQPNSGSSVLILYCGPATDESHVMACGAMVAAKLVPENYAQPYIYYKSDAQTTLGTRATGQRKNWLYRLKVK